MRLVKRKQCGDLAVPWDAGRCLDHKGGTEAAGLGGTRMSRSVAESGGVLLGFQTVRAGDQRSEAWRSRRALAAYARSNGFRFGQMFVHEEARGRPGALIRAAAHPQVTTVAVVSATDLGQSPRVQEVIRARLESGAGVRVVVVGSR